MIVQLTIASSYIECRPNKRYLDSDDGQEQQRPPSKQIKTSVTSITGYSSGSLTANVMSLPSPPPPLQPLRDRNGQASTDSTTSDRNSSSPSLTAEPVAEIHSWASTATPRHATRSNETACSAPSQAEPSATTDGQLSDEQLVVTGSDAREHDGQQGSSLLSSARRSSTTPSSSLVDSVPVRRCLSEKSLDSHGKLALLQ